MRKTRLLILCVLWLCGAGLAAAAQADKTSPRPGRAAAAEREVREFYDAYAEDLRRHRREAIAERYDPRGVFFLGNGNKTFETFASVKNSYLTKWAGPKSFAWRDLSFEVLSPEAAVVVGLFEWQTEAGQTMTFSYTGLLLKRGGRWRIRVEDESTRPPRPPAPAGGD